MNYVNKFTLLIDHEDLKLLMLNKTFLKDSLGLGFLLWLFGYLLGFVFFFIVPKELIGWFITPLGIAATVFVLWKWIKSTDLKYYFGIAVVWTLIAIICDYFFLVQLLKPEDGYYKLDVYIYYGFTLLLPVVIGWWKNKQ